MTVISFLAKILGSVCDTEDICCPTPYNRKQNVSSASLNKTFHFLVSTPVISRFLSSLAKILGSVCDTEDICCPTPYNRKQNVLSASLNKTFHFLVSTPVISR